MSVIPPETVCAGFINVGGRIEAFEATSPATTGAAQIKVGSQTVTGLWDIGLDSISFTIPGPVQSVSTEFQGYVFNNEPKLEQEQWAMAGEFVSIVFLPGPLGGPPRLRTRSGGWYAEIGRAIV